MKSKYIANLVTENHYFVQLFKIFTTNLKNISQKTFFL